MAKRESVKRLPPRKDSFDTLENDDISPENPSVILLSDDNGSSNALSTESNSLSSDNLQVGSHPQNHKLMEENEKLRQLVLDLQSQVTILKKHLSEEDPPTRDQSDKQRRKCQQKQLPQQSTSSGGVLLDLSPSMALGCLKERSSSVELKDHNSSSTEDEQETVEPNAYLDLHESASGLKHRHGGTKIIAGTPVSVYRNGSAGDTRKTDTISSNDGSLSSTASHFASMDMEAGRANAASLSEETQDLLTEPGASTPSDNESFWSSIWDRAGWLVGLLVLQSMSSFILARNEALLQQHVVIVRFLTMLVGAGGNAGNQASVRVIRGLAVGTIDDSNSRRVIRREFVMGMALSIILGTAGCIRAAVFLTPWLETVAITSSLFMIVLISIVLGALMPMGMKNLGIDPAHSSTTIQVIMDILGVTITVWMSSLILDSDLHTWIIHVMSDGDAR